MRARLLLLAIAASCYQPAVAIGVPCADNGACPSGLECRDGTCERAGGDGGLRIDACAGATCSGNDIVGCGEPVTCTTACSSIGGAHCMVLVPSNGLDATLLVGATANVMGNWTFYGDGEIRKGNINLRASGTGIISGIGFQQIEGMAVYTARSFLAAAGDTLDASPGPSPVVLFAATTIVIDGAIDAGASGNVAGPGGTNGNTSTASSGCRGGAGRVLGTGVGDGGGGGGGATAGGSGGSSASGASTGLGGSACDNPTTIPLRGGNGGGAGAQSISNAGGGGGGAIALVAMESITITGTVGTPGGGGVAGNGNGGGGGGGGGALFLEAPTVIISGAVTANGGSGAAPSTGDGLRGSISSATPANAGSDTCPVILATRRGGVGGAGMASPTAGETCTYDDGLGTNGSRGAGGGGSVGRIEIKALIATTQGAVISPPPALTTPLLE